MKNQHAAGPQKKTQVKPADADFQGGCFGLVLCDHDKNRADPDAQDKNAAEAAFNSPYNKDHQPKA